MTNITHTHVWYKKVTEIMSNFMYKLKNTVNKHHQVLYEAE